MESLFYALGVLLSGAFVLHFSSQISYTLWLLYFIVGQMLPYIRVHDPWTPVKPPDEGLEGELGYIIVSRKRGGGSSWPYASFDPAWKANPKAMTVVASTYLFIDLVLLVWCAYIFALIVRLRRLERVGAVRHVLRLTCSRLATPAFASSIMLGGYLCYGFWVWFTLCEPGTSMRSMNLANALMLTVPNALFTIIWVIGNGCEITDYIRGRRLRQNDIPLPNLGPGGRPPAPAMAGARAPFGGAGGNVAGVGGVGGAGARFRDIRDALRQDIQIVLTQLARIMATLLALRR